MKKKTYKRPQIEAVVVIGPRLMLGGSDIVKDFQNGGEIPIGDED